MLVKLTHTDGEEVWVNADYVVGVYPVTEEYSRMDKRAKSIVKMHDGDVGLFPETPDEIAARLNCGFPR